MASRSPAGKEDNETWAESGLVGTVEDFTASCTFSTNDEADISLACIAEAKLHPQESPEAKVCNHSCLLDVLQSDQDLEAALLQIQLGKHLATMQSGSQAGHIRSQILVWPHNQIQASIVSTGPPCVVSFPHHV